MRISDWSSDVCSSDLLRGTAPLLTALVTLGVLGEPATMQEIAGIALVGAAMFVMIAGRHVASNALGWALLTGVFIASYTVIDAHGVRAAPTPASYIVWVFVTMGRSEEHTSELQSLMRISYAVFCLTK